MGLRMTMITEEEEAGNRRQPIMSQLEEVMVEVEEAMSE